MAKQDIQVYQQNLSLKKEFDTLGLDLEEVFESTPLDLDLENLRLQSLLDFVKKYQECGSRETMEIIGGDFCFPPIFPGISPDSDWYRFELWLQGEATRKTIAEQMPKTSTVKDPSAIPDEEMETELARLVEAIGQAGYGISLNDGVPPRLVYKYIKEWIGETFELSGPEEGGWAFDGCGGYCPDCFQRPWCGTGLDSCWPEDKEAGKMCLPNELKDYVSASPQSLAILQKNDEDMDIERMEIRNPDDGYGDVAGSEDWKTGVN